MKKEPDSRCCVNENKKAAQRLHSEIAAR